MGVAEVTLSGETVRLDRILDDRLIEKKQHDFFIACMREANELSAMVAKIKEETDDKKNSGNQKVVRN